jgi:hypothetical protein
MVVLGDEEEMRLGVASDHGRDTHCSGPAELPERA